MLASDRGGDRVRRVTAGDGFHRRYPWGMSAMTGQASIPGGTMAATTRVGILMMLAACGGGERAARSDSAAMSSSSGSAPAETTAMASTRRTPREKRRPRPRTRRRRPRRLRTPRTPEGRGREAGLGWRAVTPADRAGRQHLPRPGGRRHLHGLSRTGRQGDRRRAEPDRQPVAEWGRQLPVHRQYGHHRRAQAEGAPGADAAEGRCHAQRRPGEGGRRVRLFAESQDLSRPAPRGLPRGARRPP